MNKLKVFAIELTNWCNAQCSFCPYPSPEHNRQKGYMTDDTFEKMLDVVNIGGVNLSGLGEPTLHPKLVQYVEALTLKGFIVQLNTNGRRLSQDLYDRLVRAGLHNVVVTADFFAWKREGIKESKHCPVTMLTITREPDRPDLGQVRKPLDDWGGQLGKVERELVSCSYVFDHFYDIMWDGRIKKCHVDFNGNHAFGSIHNPKDVAYCADTSIVKTIPLCKGCSGYKFNDGIVSGSYDGEGPNLVELTL